MVLICNKQIATCIDKDAPRPYFCLRRDFSIPYIPSITSIAVTNHGCKKLSLWVYPSNSVGLTVHNKYIA